MNLNGTRMGESGGGICGAYARWRAFAFVSGVAAMCSSFPASAADSYTAPDGQILRRTIEGVLPKPLIVICSDRPDLYIPQIQKFADYVMADMGFEIVDGRHAPQDLAIDKATFVYMGGLPAGAGGEACLARYPELMSFFAEKRTDPPILSAEGIVPGSTAAQTLKVGARILYDRRKGSKFENQLYFCYHDSSTCEVEFSISLFGLDQRFCELNQPDLACNPS